uniref:Tektin n=1 Tax=Cacopsylla melanoneura TaxID=428564 RepID=A0A8D8TWE5_9HEMI
MLGVHQVHNINSECLHIRSLRMEDDHLNDEPYKQLIQESNLVKDLEKLMADTLIRVQDQIKTNIAVKSNLQLDWSQKTGAFNIDAQNLSLNIKSGSILFRASSAREPEK